MAVTMSALKAANSVRSFVKDIGESPLDKDGNIEGAETDEIHTKIKPGLMDLAAIGGVAASATTIFLTEGHLVDAASYSTASLAPYAAYQKHELRKLGGLRGQQNFLRQNINKLSNENTVLSNRLDSLETQVDKLEHVEDSLEKVAEEGNSTVEHLMSIQRRLTTVQEKMKVVLSRKVLSVLVGIILESDHDRNFLLSPQEILMMKLRLRSVEGVTFHEENFHKLLPEDPREPVELNDIMKIVWNLKDDSIPDEQRVFTLCPDQLVKKV